MTRIFTAALGLSLAVASNANAFDDFGRIVSNGTKLTGIALPSAEANHAVVTAVTLASGEAVDLRSQESE